MNQSNSPKDEQPADKAYEDNLNVILLPLLTEMSQQPDISHAATYSETKQKLKAWRDQEKQAAVLAAREKVTYEYRVEDTPRYCVVEEEWELYDVYPVKWNAGNKVLVFRKQVQNSPKGQQ